MRVTNCSANHKGKVLRFFQELLCFYSSSQGTEITAITIEFCSMSTGMSLKAAQLIFSSEKLSEYIYIYI